MRPKPKFFLKKVQNMSRNQKNIYIERLKAMFEFDGRDIESEEDRRFTRLNNSFDRLHQVFIKNVEAFDIIEKRVDKYITRKI